MTVQLCGDAPVPQQVDAVRITLLDAQREVRRERVVELLQCPEGTVRRLPHSVDFDPFDGEAWGVVQGLKEGVEVLHYERRVTLTADEPASLSLALNDDCLGVTCPLGQTCIGGRCTRAPYEANSQTVCASAKPGGTVPDAGDASDTAADTAPNDRLDTGSAPDADVGGDADTGPTFNPRTLCPSYDAAGPADVGEDLQD